MRTTSVICAALALATFSAAPVRAQFINHRDGTWFDGGIGTGSVSVNCFDCEPNSTSGFSGYLSAGGTLTHHWLIGAELNGWFRSDQGVNESMGFLSGVARWYPWVHGGLYFKGGLGVMWYKADDGVNQLTANAPAILFGIGYDIQVSRYVAVTPYLNSFGTSSVSFRYNGSAAPTGEDMTASLVQLGLALHWQ